MTTPTPIGVVYPGTQQPHAQGGYVVPTNALGQRDALYHITQPANLQNQPPVPYPPNSQRHGTVYPGAATVAGNAISPSTTVTVGQPQVVYLAPAQGRPFCLTASNQKILKAMGITLIILGLLSFVFNLILCIIGDTFLTYAAPGIWCGVLIIITGAFGVHGAKRKSKPLLITFLVLTIITAVFCLAAYLVLAAIGVAINSEGYHRGDHSGVTFCGAMLILNAFVAGVVAIVGSGISCGVLCCRGGSSGSVQYVAVAGGPQGQPVVVPAGVSYPPQHNLGVYLPTYSAQQAGGISGTNDAANREVTKRNLAAQDAEQDHAALDGRLSNPPPYSSEAPY